MCGFNESNSINPKIFYKMKIYKTNEIKNIALIGSKGSGKTTLAESMLFECGVIKRRGNIESGNTVSDYFPVEKNTDILFSLPFSMLSSTARNLT